MQRGWLRVPPAASWGDRLEGLTGAGRGSLRRGSARRAGYLRAEETGHRDTDIRDESLVVLLSYYQIKPSIINHDHKNLRSGSHTVSGLNTSERPKRQSAFSKEGPSGILLDDIIHYK